MKPAFNGGWSKETRINHDSSTAEQIGEDWYLWQIWPKL
jgi:hypothetical protein